MLTSFFFFSSCVPAMLENLAGEGLQNSFEQDFQARMASPDSIKLSWTADPDKFSRYVIYQVFGNLEVTLTGLAGDESSYVVKNGVSPGVTYTYKLVGLPLTGTTNDSRAAITSVEVPQVQVAWQLVNAVGPSPGSTTYAVVDAAITDPTAMFVRLQWKKTSSTSVTTWHLYRSEDNDDTDWTEMTPIYSGSLNYYVDQLDLTEGKKLYYSVVGTKPDGKLGLISKITYVRVPPQHQALIHRESANFEMCRLLNSDIDPENHNQCAFGGLGSNGLGFYDFGKLLFVDRYEVGINVSEELGSCFGNPSYSCANPPSFATHVATNFTTRFANSSQNTVFGFTNSTGITGSFNGQRAVVGTPIIKTYDPGNPAVEVAIHGSTQQNAVRTNTGANYNWRFVPFRTVSDSFYARKLAELGYTNAPKRIPADFHSPGFGETDWFNPCSNRQTEGFGKSRIPWRFEQVIYSAWPLDSEPQRRLTATSAPISSATLESGDNNLSIGSCNTDAVIEIKNDAVANNRTTENLFYPAGDLLPFVDNNVLTWFNSAANASLALIKTVSGYYHWGMVTGSTHTRNCVSRYGVQDAIGNAWDAVDVSMTFRTAVVSGDKAMGNNIRGTQDPYMTQYNMDGVDGPGGHAYTGLTYSSYNSLGITPATCVHLHGARWPGSSPISPVTHFLPTLGVPFLHGSMGALPIGEVGTRANLTSDLFCVDYNGTDGDTDTDKSRFGYTGGTMVKPNSWPIDNTSVKAYNVTNGWGTPKEIDHLVGRWTFLMLRATTPENGNVYSHKDALGGRCVTEDN